MPNFVKIVQLVAKKLRFFNFSRWRPPPSWIFEIVNFYLLTVSGGPRRIIVPNFVKISRSITDILRFFEFSRWALLQSWIFENVKFYSLLGSKVARHISVPNFVKVGQSVAKITRFFNFSRWRPPPYCIFEIVNFYLLPVSAGPRRITVPNFVKIACSIVDILRFFDFSRWRLPPSCIFKIVNFCLLLVSAGARRINVPNFVKIGRSIAERLRFFDFQDGRRRHLGFLKSRNFIGFWGPECGDASTCQILSKSVVKILRFFSFSRWRLSAILDLFGAYLDNPQWVLQGLYHSAMFGYDWCSSFYNMNISIFGTFGWKIPIHAPKIGGFGAIWSPKWAAILTKAKKSTPLRESASFEPLSVKMWSAVWPVGALLKKGV